MSDESGSASENDGIPSMRQSPRATSALEKIHRDEPCEPSIGELVLKAQDLLQVARSTPARVVVQDSKKCHIGDKIFPAPITVNHFGPISSDKPEEWLVQEANAGQRKRRVMYTSLACVVVLLSLGISITIYFSEANRAEPTPLQLKESWFCDRKCWGALPARRPIQALLAPIPFVVIGDYSLPVGFESLNVTECMAKMRAIQNQLMVVDEMSDILFNYYVCGSQDGVVFEGRGAMLAGEHTSDTYDLRSLGICFLGTFWVNAPSAVQLKHAQDLIQEAERQGVLTSDYQVFGQRQVVGVASPGNALFERLQYWRHFTLWPSRRVQELLSCKEIKTDKLSFPSSLERLHGLCPLQVKGVARNRLVALMGAGLVFFTLLGIAGWLLSVSLSARTPPHDEEQEDKSGDETRDCWYVPRSKWNATESRGNLSVQPVPFQFVVISHAPRYPCYTKRECIAQVQQAQSDRQADGYPDLAYHFLVGGDGRVYEGIGWHWLGYHTLRCAPFCMGVIFMGDYDSSGVMGAPPTDQQLQSFLDLFKHGSMQNVFRPNVLPKNVTILAQCSIEGGSSPGDMLHAALRDWPYYDSALADENCSFRKVEIN